MRYALLALLGEGSTYGYELKQAFERLFRPVWPPINVGQIYTTLGRLERDGLVSSREVEQSRRPDKRVYELTGEGKAALANWMTAPVEGAHLKDEFFMKLVLASLAGTNAIQLVDRQRNKYLQALRDLDTLALETEAESPARLLIEGAILHLQADLKWLDRCEERLEDGLGRFHVTDGSPTEKGRDATRDEGPPAPMGEPQR
jgi:DNA-binding PadR family transcriptional regulator